MFSITWLSIQGLIFLERDWNVKSERQFIASRRHAEVLLTKAFLRSAEKETNDESAEQADSDRAANTREKCYCGRFLRIPSKSVPMNANYG
jgi:hypothetical protein